MIGFLRFLGLMNAAVWFGAAVFFTFSAEPAASSEPMKELLGGNNFPYFSVAIGNVIARGFFRLYVSCSVIALLYLVAEWLYFGKYPPKRWLLLILTLILLGVIRGYWLQPTLMGLHAAQQGRQARVEQREEAARAFGTWSFIARCFDLMLAAGLAVYVWRVGNPTEPTRFVRATKFPS